MHKKKDEIRDIYQSSTHDLETDFTPQVAQELLETRQRDLRRSRLVSIFFGSLIIVLSVVLIAVVIRDFLSGHIPAAKVGVQEKPFIPRHPLPAETFWVMDYQPPATQTEEDEKPGRKPLSGKWVKTAASYIIKGQQALAINELNPALEHFKKAVEIYPETEGLHRVIGMLYLQRKEYPQAVQHLEKALREEESFDAISTLGTTYISTEEYDKAEKYLKRALGIRPESPVCHKNLAALYRKMKRDNDAVYHFEKYLDMQPDDLDTLQTYAMYLTRLGRWKEAAAALTALTKEVPDIAPVYFLLAQAQVQSGQQDKAVEALKRGIRLIDPVLALAWMSREEFNPLRNTPEFKTLTGQLEAVTVPNRLSSPAR